VTNPNLKIKIKVKYLILNAVFSYTLHTHLLKSLSGLLLLSEQLIMKMLRNNNTIGGSAFVFIAIIDSRKWCHLVSKLTTNENNFRSAEIPSLSQWNLKQPHLGNHVYWQNQFFPSLLNAQMSMAPYVHTAMHSFDWLNHE
jgi:hypothetical protein